MRVRAQEQSVAAYIADYGVESLLPCCVPDLQFVELLIDLQHLEA